MPDHFPGIDVDGDERTCEEILQTVAAHGPCIGRRRVSRSHDVETRFGIVRAWYPRVAASMNCRIEVLPSLETGFACLLRRGVPLPLQLSRFGMKRLQESRHV